MKFLALLLVSLIAACYAADPLQLNEQQRQRVREVGKGCIAEEGTTKEAVLKLKNGDFANAGQKEKCFVNCFLTKLNFLQNGVPQESFIREKLGAIVGQEKVNALISTCNSHREAENCGTAFKIYECYFKNNAPILA